MLFTTMIIELSHIMNIFWCYLFPVLRKCEQEAEVWLINPLTLRAAKRGLTILKIFQLQKHFIENI